MVPGLTASTRTPMGAHSRATARVKPTMPAKGRMVRWRIRQRQSQKVSQPKRIRRAPRNAAFGIQTLEIADQQKPEVNARRQPRAPHPGRIKLRTDLLHKVVKPVIRQNGVEAFVKRMRRRLRDLSGRNPESFLSLAFLFSQCHGPHCNQQRSDRAIQSL